MKKRTNVTLRQRVLPSGRTTLYLDYTCGGKRRIESLKLFLEPELTRADKQRNRETLRMAQAVVAKRQVEIRDNDFGFERDMASETNFCGYFASLTEQRKLKSGGRSGRWQTWESCMAHIRKYDPHIEDKTFSEIDAQWVKGFKAFLVNDARSMQGVKPGKGKGMSLRNAPLSNNTRLAYYSIARACMNQAVRDHIIRDNPFDGIKGFKEEEGSRMYLTIEEVRRLSAAVCKYPELKRAFLFSCLTGLRRSDILKLTWGEVQEQGEFTRIIFRQKKTGGQEYIDIAPQAALLLGERGRVDARVFGPLPELATCNIELRRWAKAVGITKHISFHCGRHTFAVMMLDLGADIYTVSKLLGHRELSTTQIYAKILDKNKQAAVARIPDILS